MTEFAELLSRAGIEHVECYDWSGSVIATFLARDAERYSSHLRAAADSGPLSIVSKSLGAIVAEQALLIAAEVSVDIFIRIGVPDRRSTLSLANVNRVVNVVSSGDRLDRLASRFLTPLLSNVSDAATVRGDEIRLAGLSHRQLTSARMLDLYSRLLLGEDVMQTIEKRDTP